MSVHWHATLAVLFAAPFAIMMANAKLDGVQLGSAKPVPARIKTHKLYRSQNNDVLMPVWHPVTELGEARWKREREGGVHGPQSGCANPKQMLNNAVEH